MFLSWRYYKLCHTLMAVSPKSLFKASQKCVAPPPCILTSFMNFLIKLLKTADAKSTPSYFLGPTFIGNKMKLSGL